MADRYVVLRDGRNAGGGPPRGRRARRSTPSWSAAGSRTSSRSARHPGEAILDVGRDRPRIDRLHAPPRRGARHRRPHGRGTDAAAAHAVRPRARAFPAASGSARTPAPPRHPRAGRGHGPPQRGPQRRRPGPGSLRGGEPRPLAPHGPGPRTPRPPPSRLARAARALDRGPGRVARPARTSPVREPLRREPAKVALARLLHHDVDVLLLDEPTRGIDVASKAQIYALVDGLVAPAPAAATDGGRAPRPCSWPAVTWPSCSACAIASRSCAGTAGAAASGRGVGRARAHDGGDRAGDAREDTRPLTREGRCSASSSSARCSPC